MARGLRQEEVDRDVEVEPLERLAGEGGVGKRDQRVEADREQPADLAAVDQLDDLGGGRAPSRQTLDRDMPLRGHVCPMLRVLDVARARELVAPLSVLASALAVALPGDGGVAAA